MSSHIVRSTHGEFTIDERGNITSLRLETDSESDAIHFSRILKFDVYEWMRYWKEPHLPSSFDILDLPYWYRDETGYVHYAEADDTWREDIAKQMLGRKK